MFGNLQFKQASVFLILIVLVVGGIYNFTNIKDENYLNGYVPELSFVTVENDKKYKTVKGNGMWISNNILKGSVAGSSYIVDIENEFLENCNFIEIQPEEEIQFNIPYKELISEVSISLYDTSLKKVTDTQLIDDPYIFKAPKEGGEYYYTINIVWDEYHNFEYIFKIRIKL